ncbi:hypothetical protein SCOCK_150176 [Actinacidiphila cocklensis]|uniref:Uncharacterized protein n=1 Tax=Actinacidiphila cocklensis TaxID=887465 RepID=A0A9W4GQ24_9ACTN|nr:hypothetical protein SCOCK_150176 [Actinacidiphila cocklensis]
MVHAAGHHRERAGHPPVARAGDAAAVDAGGRVAVAGGGGGAGADRRDDVRRARAGGRAGGAGRAAAGGGERARVRRARDLPRVPLTVHVPARTRGGPLLMEPLQHDRSYGELDQVMRA